MTKYACTKCSSEFYSTSRDKDFLKCPFCGHPEAKALTVDRVEVTNASNGVILSIPEHIFSALVGGGLLSWDGVNEGWLYEDANEVAIVQTIHDAMGPILGAGRLA